MTEPPSPDQSRHKSDLEPGALLRCAICLHCLTHDPSTDLMTAEVALKFIPRHWEVYLTPVSLLAESTGASYFMNRGSKIRTSHAFSKHKIIFFVSLCLFLSFQLNDLVFILSVCQSSWEFIMGTMFCAHKR